jgi:hypothetical protein
MMDDQDMIKGVGEYILGVAAAAEDHEKAATRAKQELRKIVDHDETCSAEEGWNYDRSHSTPFDHIPSPAL